MRCVQTIVVLIHPQANEVSNCPTNGED